MDLVRQIIAARNLKPANSAKPSRSLFQLAATAAENVKERRALKAKVFTCTNRLSLRLSQHS